MITAHTSMRSLWGGITDPLTVGMQSGVHMHGSHDSSLITPALPGKFGMLELDCPPASQRYMPARKHPFMHSS